MGIKRIIPCLDIRKGREVKGKRFKDVYDVDDPAVLAEKYYKDGADELVFYDITASQEDRKMSLDFIERVVNAIPIPIIVGGGVNTLEDISNVLTKGARKVSINTGALKNPQLIREGSLAYGPEAIVLSIDSKKTDRGKWNVFTGGGTIDTGIDAIEWAREGLGLGAGELVINSIDEDGMKKGYDLDLLEILRAEVKVPIIASGGAGKLEDFSQAVLRANVDGVLAASVFHYGELTIGEVKQHMKSMGIEVNMDGY